LSGWAGPKGLGSGNKARILPGGALGNRPSHRQLSKAGDQGPAPSLGSKGKGFSRAVFEPRKIQFPNFRPPFQRHFFFSGTGAAGRKQKLIATDTSLPGAPRRGFSAPVWEGPCALPRGEKVRRNYNIVRAAAQPGTNTDRGRNAKKKNISQKTTATFKPGQMG